MFVVKKILFLYFSGNFVYICKTINHNYMMNMKFTSIILALSLSMPALAQDKALYDFVVPRDGSFREALSAASNRKDKDTRFRIFVMQGEYVIPTEGTTTGGDGNQYGDPRSYLKAPNTSIIGEDRDNTVIMNTVPPATWNNGFGKANPLEGIGQGDVLIIEKRCNNTYLQDITMKNAMEDNTGRNIVLHDKSDKTIAKNICIWGFQDTYVSDNQIGRYYFEGGVIRGRTDYICGKGDVVFNEVKFQQCGKGGYLAVPSVPRKYGYVMFNCHIAFETPDVTYYLGRPWGKGTPRAIWLNTKVDGGPITGGKKGHNGWTDMSGGWPALFTEYNTTMSTTGEKLDLTQRRSIYTDNDGVQHSNAPFLTEAEANHYNIPKIFEAWEAQNDTKEATEPSNVKLDANGLSWTGSDDALLYAIVKNGKVVDFTIETSYKTKGAKTDKWAVRAANKMGGLGKAIEAK